MPLNYSKWDTLEVSDDSDIEGHPNVDHKSLVRWKQRDIHEKREQRKVNIARLEAQIACNSVLLPRITEFSNDLANESKLSMPRTKYYSNIVEKIQSNPSKDCPPGNDPSKIEQTYDGMMLELLNGTSKEGQNKVSEWGSLPEAEREERLGGFLAARIAEHVTLLTQEIEKHKKDLAEELAEQKKKITSDDIHTGFDQSNLTKAQEPAPVPKSKVPKQKVKDTVTEFETLNPGAGSSAPAPAHADDEADTDDEGLPEMTPSLLEFSHLPLRGFQKSLDFIQSHPEVFAKGSSDALLVSAFRAQSNNKPKYAKKCIHQSLLLQYCDKLGKDGVRMFFNKMIAGDQRAQKVFLDDVESTYAHLVQRVLVVKEEEEKDSGVEQIQLVAEDPSTEISFNVPDGPPPEDLRLEGPGTEDLDIEDVRRALQLRWEVFQEFPKDFQEALKTNKLDEVNKVLGSLPVEAAEKLVGALDNAGILSFSEKGIRDETGGLQQTEGD